MTIRLIEPDEAKGKGEGNGTAPPAADRPAAESTPAEALTDTPDDKLVPFADVEAALGLEDDGIIATEMLLSIDCRKPRGRKGGEYVRVHPDPKMTRGAQVFIDVGIGDPVYLVAPAVRPYIADHLTSVQLVLCVNRQDVLFLWPIKLSDINAGNGRRSRWTTTALAAAEVAKTQWIKLMPGDGGYNVVPAENPDLPGPNWPDKYTFVELVNLAFKGCFIADKEHPIVQRLRAQK
jgi:hypothetical protein